MSVPSTRSILQVGGGRMIREPRNVSSIIASFEHMRATTGAITSAAWGAAAPEVMSSVAPSDCSLVETVTFIDIATAGGSMTITIPAPTADRTGVDNPTGMFKLFVMTTAPGGPFTTTITPTVPGVSQSVILTAQYQTALYVCTGTAWQLVATTGTSAGGVGATLAATLRAGNTTHDATSPGGFAIDGTLYSIDIDNAGGFSSGIFSNPTFGAAPGSDFYIIAGGSTTGPGGDVTIRAGQTTSGTGGDAFLAGGSAASGNGGSANLVGAQGGLPNGNSGRVHIVDGIPNGTGTGGGVLIESSNSAGTGSAGDVELLAGTGGSAGAPGSVFLAGGASTSLQAGGRIQFTPGPTTVAGVRPGDVVMIPQIDGGATLCSSMGIFASGATSATHFIAEQTTAPTILGGAAPIIAAGSSDMAGILAAIDANTDVTVTFNRAFPVGSRVFVVLTPGVATATPVWVVSTSATNFVLRTAEPGGLAIVYYMVIASNF